MGRVRALPGLLLVLVAACTGAPPLAPPPPDDTGPRRNPLTIVNHGWHTGLIVPAAALEALLPDLAARFDRPVYYEIGWGDQGFYQADEIGTSLALRALFWSGGTVVHVVALTGTPGAYFPHSETVQTCLTDQGLRSLLAFLAHSFVRDPTRQLLPLSRGIYGDSQFYEGSGRYSALNTCNTWTAQALRSAGLDISPAWKLTASSVMSALPKADSPPVCAY